jgi:hypothetical protein
VSLRRLPTVRREPERAIPGVTKLAPAVEWQIVGVFHNVHDAGLRQNFPEMLVPSWQIPWPNTGIGVRTAENPASMAKSIAAAVHSADPQIALIDTKTMEEVKDQGLAGDRFSMLLFASFAGVALLLAAVGIYCVMSFSVSLRAHEVALSMALGATRGRVIGLVIKEGVILACAGLALGLAGAYLLERNMQGMLFGIGRFDLSAFAAVGLILLTTALLACYFPAHRAPPPSPWPCCAASDELTGFLSQSVLSERCLVRAGALLDNLEALWHCYAF